MWEFIAVADTSALVRLGPLLPNHTIFVFSPTVTSKSLHSSSPELAKTQWCNRGDLNILFWSDYRVNIIEIEVGVVSHCMGIQVTLQDWHVCQQLHNDCMCTDSCKGVTCVCESIQELHVYRQRLKEAWEVCACGGEYIVASIPYNSGKWVTSSYKWCHFLLDCGHAGAEKRVSWNSDDNELYEFRK